MDAKGLHKSKSAPRESGYTTLPEQAESGSACLTAGTYQFAGYTDEFEGPAPQANETQARLEEGDIFPFIESTSRSCRWRLTNGENTDSGSESVSRLYKQDRRESNPTGYTNPAGDNFAEIEEEEGNPLDFLDPGDEPGGPDDIRPA